MKLLRLTGSFLLSALIVSPQTADPVIHVDVNLRQVDLTVTDAKGNHVSDLQPTDFELLEDGKPQKITNFSWVEVTPPPSGARLAALREKPSLLEWYSGVARFRKTPGNDILSAPVANLRKEEIRRVISIVIADPAMPVRDRVRKFIDEQAGPGDMVSIRSTQRFVAVGENGRTAIRDSPGILHQFTNDKRQLDAATERLFSRGCGIYLCLIDVPGAIASAIASLKDLPGRKALLFVGRFNGQIDALVNMANRAGVVIYVLDPVGVVFEGTAPDNTVAQDSERLLSEKTGGHRLLTTAGFDLTRGFNEVIEDLSGYYLLGYHPPMDGPALKSPVRHKITVRVLRAGLTARVRDGIMGAADPVAGPDPNPATKPLGREETLTKALFSVFTEDGMRVHLEPLFAASAPNKKNKRSSFVRAMLEIDGRDLAFTDSDGAPKKTVLDIVAAVFDEDGAQAGAANKAFSVVVPKSVDLTHASLQYHLDVPLSRPGAYQVRAAVRDQTSGAVWSGSAFLEIPDFNRPRISLSSLVLRLPQGTPATPATARPDWSEFQPGTTVEYFCEVFGLKTPGKPPVPPDVEAEVKLYRGGGPVAGIPPSPVKLENIGDQSFLTGSMRIPDDLAAGNYTMELLAYDRLESSKKKQSAEQWVDVTVLGTQK